MYPFFVSLSQKMPAFVGEPDATPLAPGLEHRSTSRPGLLPVSMDVGIDGGVGVSGMEEAIHLRPAGWRKSQN